MNNVLRLICLFVVSAVCSMCIAAQTDVPTLDTVLDQLNAAISEYEDGTESTRILEAAAELAFVLERDSIQTAGGELTLGNAYFFGGDLGHSILHYRRGLAIDPTNAQLLQNLQHARSFVEPVVSEDVSESTVWSLLMAWRGFVDRWLVWYGSLVMLGCGSVLLTLKITGWNTSLQKLILPVTVIGIIGIGTLTIETSYYNDHNAVIVTQDGYGLFAGPDAHVYLPVVEGLIGAGTEGIVLDRRDEWCQVELGNGLSGWIESDSLEPITW